MCVCVCVCLCSVGVCGCVCVGVCVRVIAVDSTCCPRHLRNLNFPHFSLLLILLHNLSIELTFENVEYGTPNLAAACTQRGLNPMGERDELLKLLIDSAQSGKRETERETEMRRQGKD